MDDFTLARLVHVASVLFWIGGVAFVTLVIFPAVRAEHLPEERLKRFHRIEGRFAPQARIWVLLAGASGLWMMWRAQMWRLFLDPHYWWLHAMVGVWLMFAVMLFVLEPLYLHRRMAASPDPERDFDNMYRMHVALLSLSVVALMGAVGGSHGLF